MMFEADNIVRFGMIFWGLVGYVIASATAGAVLVTALALCFRVSTLIWEKIIYFIKREAFFSTKTDEKFTHLRKN